MVAGDPDARLVHLARRLAEQTRAGRISWSTSAAGRRHTYAGASGSVTLEKETGKIGRLVMWVRDQNGVAVDELTAPLGSLGSLGLIGAPAAVALADLHDAVTASSQAVVDSIIAEIG